MLRKTEYTDENSKYSLYEYTYNNISQTTHTRITSVRIFNYFYTYDSKGNPDEYTYPTGFTIKNEYKPDNGTLKKVIDKSTNTTIYEPGTYNARGQMMHFAMNNKSLYTTFGYDDFGLPTYRMTGNYYPTSTNIQYLQTNFDPSTGNLNWRKDLNRSLTELFTYDEVHKNRLATWQVKWQQLYSTTYNNTNGNILTKTDFTSTGNPYTYGLDAGPHAVTGVVSPLIVPAEAEQEIRYNSFNKASYINHNYQRRELFLHYGPDEQRIKTEYKINGQPTLTRYFPGGGLEVEVDANGQERWLHYLPGGGLYVCNKDFDKIGMYYVLTDYLGSWDKVISETGTTVEEYSFDPWGRRRNPTNWTYTGVPASFTFSRGFTGHVKQPFGLRISANQLRMLIPQRNECGKMLDAFGLINMNGRMYDPVLGRMLSPDNYVSLPEHTQGYNRYTYALNNPLIITDPSGDNPVLLFIAFAGVLNGAMSAQNGDGFLQGFAIGTATAALSYGVGTAVGPVVSGGKIWADMANAGIHTAITGGITYGADALVNNAALNWKGYGLNIATSMAMAGLSYQKQGTQLPKYTRADLEAAGLQFDLGRGYGMRFGGGPDSPYKWKFWPNNSAYLEAPVAEIVAPSGQGGGWLDNIQTGLDVAGIADPTGIVDGVNALIYAGRGQWGNAGISALAIIPYIGDVGKAGRLGAKATGLSYELITRAAKGADGGLSRHVIERLDGDVISKTHQVFKDGKIIHQHQNHIGTYGTIRTFPEEWLLFPTIK